MQSGSASRLANVRDERSLRDQTARPRFRAMGQTQGRSGDTTLGVDQSPSSVHSGTSSANGIEHPRPTRRRDQSVRERLSHRPVSSRLEVGGRRTESLPGSTSTSESQDGQRDVFDTAPPSDLDIRFPALSPQPSPLNSRRHAPVDRFGDVYTTGQASNVDEITVRLPGGDQQAEETISALAEVGLPDFDSRWKETQQLVDSYLSNRHVHSSGALDVSHDRRANLANEPLHASHSRPIYSTGNEVTYGSALGGAVMNRLDAVTEEVQALRQQVAELSDILSKGFHGEHRASPSTRSLAVVQGQVDSDLRPKQRNPADFGSPVSLSLDALVTPLLRPLILSDVCRDIGMLAPCAPGFARARSRRCRGHGERFAFGGTGSCDHGQDLRSWQP